MSDTHRFAIDLSVGAPVLYRAFTDAAQLTQWMTEFARVSVKDPAELDRYISNNADVEPVVGGKIDFGWGAGPIHLLTVDSGRQVSYSWQYGDDPETVVTWRLEESQGGTRLTLVHSGFASKRTMEDYSTGWYFFVNSLKSMIEIGASWKKAMVHTS